MIVNKENEIKNFYRLVEYVSRLTGIDMSHERLKQIIFDYYQCETKQELEVKKFAEAYLYLLNNTNQSLTTEILRKTFYLLTDEVLNQEVLDELIELYYRNFDETPHYLAALIHFTVLNRVVSRKIEFAFMLSNYVMFKNGRYPLLPNDDSFDNYKKVIAENSIDELVMYFIRIEKAGPKRKNSSCLSIDEIIKRVKKLKDQLTTEFNIQKLYLFGSFAKGTNTPISDIDFLVVYKGDLVNYETETLQRRLKAFFEQEFTCNVDLVEFKHGLDDFNKKEMESIINLI